MVLKYSASGSVISCASTWFGWTSNIVESSSDVTQNDQIQQEVRGQNSAH